MPTHGPRPPLCRAPAPALHSRPARAARARGGHGGGRRKPARRRQPGAARRAPDQSGPRRTCRRGRAPPSASAAPRTWRGGGGGSRRPGGRWRALKGSRRWGRRPRRSPWRSSRERRRARAAGTKQGAKGTERIRGCAPGANAKGPRRCDRHAPQKQPPKPTGVTGYLGLEHPAGAHLVAERGGVGRGVVGGRVVDQARPLLVERGHVEGVLLALVRVVKAE